MARPRVFISSTYYDLKHVRSSLDNFVDSLGFDSVLSEKGDIAFAPDVALDESCYREASGADIFVLIIGGRYGSASSTEESNPSRSFFERYESITKKEYDSACSRDIPAYILIEHNVHSEYHTYLRNKDNEKIQYAHVDSINIFRLIEDILSKPRNNPVHTFERFVDIENWLREQWAGLFRELLQRMSSQKQIATLSGQIETLGELNATLQRYLEVVISKVSPDEAKELIESERERLELVEQLELLRGTEFYQLGIKGQISLEAFREILLTSTSIREFDQRVEALDHSSGLGRMPMLIGIEDSPEAIQNINAARSILGLEHLPVR